MENFYFLPTLLRWIIPFMRCVVIAFSIDAEKSSGDKDKIQKRPMSKSL